MENQFVALTEPASEGSPALRSSRWPPFAQTSRSEADPPSGCRRRESRRRKHYWGFDDEGVVIRLTLVVVGTCQQTPAPINLYGPLRDDVMGLPQYRLPANRERSKGTECGTGGLRSAGTPWSASHYASRRGCRFPQASIGADGPQLEQEGNWTAVLLGWSPDPLSTQGGVEVVRGAHRAICTLWQ
jgi:hypothetical protein